MKKIISMVVALASALTLVPTAGLANTTPQIKNIIYMIPDGGGMSPFYLADALKQAGGWDEGVYPEATVTSPGEMYAKQYLSGSVTTHSTSEVTDSAAAGTALSSGYKTKNGYVGVDPDKIPHANLLEAAQFTGKNVGMVSTYEWTNATPASFSAHDKDRGNYTPMSEQIVNQEIDVVLGGGFGAAKWGDISEAEIRGYDIINTKEDLANVKPGDKIWGNLASGSFPYDIENTAAIPNLAEMTKAAITALNDDNENGFFLMVEGSKIDGGGHSNYVRGMVGDFLAFDEACKIALNFAEERNDTIVVIVPDHDTGGMNLPENTENAVNDLKKGIEPADITWESANHTARHGGLFLYVPEGFAYPEGISGNDMGTQKAYDENLIDNTEIAPYLAGFMNVKLEDVSKTLFVDVTDKGTYNADMDLFMFNDYPVSVQPNTSYAFVGDDIADLEGQVALYINGKFYVPQLLLDIAENKASYDICEFASSLSASMDTYMPDSTDITKWIGRIKVSNLFASKEFKGKIQFTYPESFAAMEPFEITIGNKSTEVVEFECPEFDTGDVDLKFKYKVISEDGKEYSYAYKFKGLAYAGYASDEVKIDGIIDEDVWSKAVIMTCDDASRLVMIEDWKGERDLSADFAMLWDENYFYLYAVVTDEIFAQKELPSALWQGDSVQFGLYHDTENALINGTAGKAFEEIGIAFIDGEPTAYRFVSRTGDTPIGIIERGEGFDMACVREGDDLTYELKFRWSDIFGYEFDAKEGTVLGFSALINDNDGDSRRGWMEYGSGIGKSKNVNDFVMMPLVDFSEKSSEKDEIEIYCNGEKVTSDVPPMLIEDRVFVPVRAIFEALGAEVMWDGETQTVFSMMGEQSVIMQIGNNEVFIDGQMYTLEAPLQIVNDRTLAPVRAISEAFGCNVNWDMQTKTVTVTK